MISQDSVAAVKGSMQTAENLMNDFFDVKYICLFYFLYTYLIVHILYLEHANVHIL